MDRLSQSNAPLYEALLEYRQKRIVPFDVPGHKQGRGNPELADFLGRQCLNVDVNSMKPLDNLCHPVGVIRDAAELAAGAFCASNAFFMVGGTSSAVQAMVMSACRDGDKIILPRNVHRSVIGALILSGARPVYVNPGLNTRLGIPLGMSVADVEKAIGENPDAKAIFVNNPTYYGICSDIGKITKMAHAAGMLVLADEAHGTHFYFGENMPASAMKAGCDMASVSMHKTGGSLTQSSLLLLGPGINAGHVRQTINLTQTTSASYLLMASLDLSRRSLALRGKEIFARVSSLAEYARGEINRIGGYYAFSSIFDFDATKLSVHTLDLGLAGIEVYDILRDDYNIQIEFGDIGNFLAIISVGDRSLEIERLVSSLSEIRRLYAKDPSGMFDHEYIPPRVELPPKQAFYAAQRSVPVGESENKICGEFVMAYPPGIPILAPGERITGEILKYIAYAKEKGSFLTGTEDLKIETIKVLEA
jgi:arginine/lysine/ornithine decarboxylase